VDVSPGEVLCIGKGFTPSRQIILEGENAMKKSQLFVLILTILLALGMAACERNASTPAPGTEPEADFPLPGDDAETPTQNAMDELTLIATQTAQAAMDGGAAPAEGDTPAEPAGDQPEAPSEGDAAPEGDGNAEEAIEGEGEIEAETPADTDPEQGGGQIVNETYTIPAEYVVQEGEFPYCLARRFNIKPAALLNANGLNNNSQVFPGKKLTIPQDAGSFDAGSRSLKAHPTQYTVRGGDTVYKIACLFGDVDPRNIEASNGLEGAYTLSVGQVLQIP
jgi:LysM repeat protein